MQPETQHDSDRCYAAAFSEALLRPDRQTPLGISGPRGKMAVKRYNIYRNNVTVSLIDALAAVFPATQRIVGVEFFRAMARTHVGAYPPASPLLFEYGQDFPAFIGRFEHAQSMPWLADVAQIERAWLDAYHAADAAPLSAAQLAPVSADRLPRLGFTVHPATRIVRSRYSALTIFTANRGTNAIGEIDASDPEDTLITRKESDVEARRLPDGGAVFLSALIGGGSLGDAAANATNAASNFDLSASISGMLEAGAFTAIRFGDDA